MLDSDKRGLQRSRADVDDHQIRLVHRRRVPPRDRDRRRLVQQPHDLPVVTTGAQGSPQSPPNEPQSSASRGSILGIWRGCRAAWGPRSMTHLEVGEVRGIDDGLPLVRREVRRHTDDLREPMDSGALWHCG